MTRIKQQIEGGDRGKKGYHEIDQAVRAVTRGARWSVCRLFGEFMTGPILANLAYWQTTPDYNRHTSAVSCAHWMQSLELSVYWLFGAAVALCVLYRLVRVPQGKPSNCRILKCGAIALSLAISAQTCEALFGTLPLLVVIRPAWNVALTVIVFELYRMCHCSRLRCKCLTQQCIATIVGLPLIAGLWIDFPNTVQFAYFFCADLGLQMMIWRWASFWGVKLPV